MNKQISWEKTTIVSLLTGLLTVVFLVVMSTSIKGSWSNLATKILIADVVIGLLALAVFCLSLFVQIYRKTRLWAIAIAVFLLSVPITGVFMIRNNTVKNNETPLQVTSQNTHTSSPTAKPVIKGVTTTAATNKEPKTDCFGPDGKSFKTTKLECDKFNSAWGKTKSATNTQTQKTTGSTYSYTPYVPKVYYPCTICGTYSGCQTYNYLVETKAQCDAEQAKMNSSGGSYVVPAYTPQPTADPAIAIAHQQACSQAVQEWNEYKTNFYTTEYNSFGSSAQAVLHLEGERQEIQTLLNSYGCTNHISL